MANIGDAASGAGYPLVPEDGEEGRVRWGAREINRTRDMIAQLGDTIPSGKAAYRTSSGFSSGTATPANTVGADGDIYFKTL